MPSAGVRKELSPNLAFVVPVSAFYHPLSGTSGPDLGDGRTICNLLGH